MPYLEKNEKDRPWKTKREPQQRKNYDTGQATYNNRLWKNMSRRHKELEPLCQVCLQADILTDSAPGNAKGVTDHMIPIIYGGSFTHQNNLVTMCKGHHNLKSGIEKQQPIYQGPTMSALDGIAPVDRDEAIRIIATKLLSYDSLY